jgi:hypothetical protein
MRRAAKRDATEPEIVTALEGIGASVRPISSEDAPDLIVGYRRETHLVECKTGKAQLRPGQKAWQDGWNGSPVHLVNSPEAALAAIGFSWVVEAPADPGELRNLRNFYRRVQVAFPEVFNILTKPIPMVPEID